MTIHPSIAPLPAELAIPIVRMLARDRLFDLDSAKRTGVTVGQIAAHAARLVYEDWHDQMELGTRDRIKLTCENYFTPKQSDPPDPLAANAVAFNERSGFSRAESIEDPRYVTRLPISGPPVAISRHDEPELQGPSVIVTGGTAEGGEAA
jgi:hypothetical protein